MKLEKSVRRMLALMLSAVLLWGGSVPGAAAEMMQPQETAAAETVETTVPAEETTVPTEEGTVVAEETTVSTQEGTVSTEETDGPQPETTVATEETTEPTEETTIPTEETTAPTEETETVLSPYEDLLLRMEAMETEARGLSAEVDVLDAFTQRLREVWNEAYDLYDAGQLSDEELAVIDGLGWGILEDLKTEYRYENGVIATLDIQRFGSQEMPMAATAENSVASLGSGSGIRFRIYNYTNGKDASGNYITAGGVNDNGLDGYFNFRGTSYENTGANGASVGNFTNSVTDIDGYTANHATVLRSLGSDGYPVFDGSRDNGPKKSLGYLFGAGGKGVTGYTAVNTPLRLNSKGQYYYNSADNAVDFDTSSNRFIVRTYRERGKTTADQGSGQYYDFFPFTYWDGSTKAGSGAHWYNYNNTVEVDYWYGMTMEASFSMPAGGIVNGQDEMVFEFSGDDDVWVFIDGVLVLDLGGTHGVVSGSINFATGKVQQYLDWGGANSSSTGTSYPTTLKAQFEAAGKAPKGGWNGDVFADYTEHTIKFFYLERATSCANCKILFNMPILPTGELTVEKQVEGTLTARTEEADFGFTLIQKTDSGETAAGGVPFDRVDAASGDVVDTGVTASDGSFVLKAGQRAEFDLTAGKTFLVKETDPGSYAAPLNCTVNGVSQETAAATGDITIDPDAPAAVVFTNQLDTAEFSVTKQVAGNMGDRDQAFSFAVRLYAADPDADGEFITFPSPEAGEKYTLAEGEARFQLKHGETILLDDIPKGAYILLKETVEEDYETVWQVGDSTGSGAVAKIGDLTEPVQVVYTNTRELLIETGLTFDTLPYLLMTAGAGTGLLLTARRRKERE